MIIIGIRLYFRHKGIGLYENSLVARKLPLRLICDTGIAFQLRKIWIALRARHRMICC